MWGLVQLDASGEPVTALTAEEPPGSLGTGGLVANAFEVNGAVIIGGGSFDVGKFSLSGALDTSFGGDGLVEVPFDDLYYWSSILLRRPTGELVIIGSAEGGIQDPNTEDAIHLVQLESDGTLDSTSLNGRTDAWLRLTTGPTTSEADHWAPRKVTPMRNPFNWRVPIQHHQ